MLLNIDLKILIFGIISIVLIGAVGVIIFLKIKRKRKLKIKKINDKYTPMSGNDYLFIDKKTKIVISINSPYKRMLFDTMWEANVIIDSYINNKQPA